ncbi:LapA family protein [Micromonospora sp. NBC_01813]|uniref:LapA family protein n=1 Tax=Micromonospora sp. NBC_01813 TaxID=2975988 RepID=UPI002DD909FD|nr:LapA family protein [Micromonospora sp. NBC_01813]WSA09026.1 LapA family protein [Micromonospora sp. NBC_01813]
MTNPANATSEQPRPVVNDRPRPVARTRADGSLIAFGASAVVLLLLLIFILQNGQRTEVHFFGAHGQVPVGVALLLAAVAGVLLVTVHAGIRRLVKRRLAKRRDRTPQTTRITGQGSPGTTSSGSNR